MSEETIDKIKSIAVIIVVIAGMVLIIAGLTMHKTEYEVGTGLNNINSCS